MTLRARLFSLFAPLLVLTLLAVYGLSERLLLSRFDQQDNLRLQAEAHKAHALLLAHIHRTSSLLRSYAWWDGSYELLLGEGDRSRFLRRNLDPGQLANLDFDFMVLLDDRGQVVVEQWAPPDLLDMLPVGGERPRSIASLRRDILARSQRLGLLQHGGDAQFQSGQLLLVQGVPLLLTVSAVSNSQGSAEAIGSLLAGYFFDGARQENLQLRTLGDLRLLPPVAMDDDWQRLALPADTPLPQGWLSPRSLLDAQRQRIELQSANSLGEPELRLQLTGERINFRKGGEAIHFFLGLSLAIALAAALLVYIGLEFWVLRRLGRLNGEIAAIGDQARLPRVGNLGRDELGALSTGLNQMLERLEQSEARDRVVLDAIHDGYFEVDAEGRLQRFNRALERLLGYRDDQLLHRPFVELLADDEVERARQLFQQARDDASRDTFNARFRRGDGQTLDCEARVSAIRERGGALLGYRGILRDVSERMAYQRHLHDLAYRDPLTGLGNRKAFNEQLQHDLDQALSGNAGPLALLFIDLDHFKQVNDQFGHDAGDALLVAIAARLQHGLRQPGKLYRLGGDEFTLLLAGASAEAAQALGERLLASLGAPFDILGERIDFVTPSIGIALCPLHAGEAEALIKAADSAMYLAKRKRNQVVLYQPQASTAEP